MDRYYVLDTGNIRSRNTYTREETVLGTWTIYEMYLASDVDTELAKKDEEIARLNGELEDYKEGTEGLKMAVGDLRDERDKYQEEMARLKNENEQLRKMPYETDINLPRMPKKTTSINVNVGPEKEKEEIARLRKALDNIWAITEETHNADFISEAFDIEYKKVERIGEIAREALLLKRGNG